jgi:hypothetical protein
MTYMNVEVTRDKRGGTRAGTGTTRYSYTNTPVFFEFL